jgi:RimJ/RimL family protein N-acetyltransferase
MSDRPELAQPPRAPQDAAPERAAGFPAPEEALAGVGKPRDTWLARIQDAAEMWIYALNERQHGLFRLYDGINEAWARLVFRGVRRRAAAFARELAAREAGAHLRFLEPADLDAFAALLAAFGFRYVPPHPLDRAAAARALRRASYLPLGIFRGEALIGYALLRLFFPRRVVSGFWLLPAYHGTGIGVAAARVTRELTRAEALPDYVTIPLDNAPSLRAAQAAGWRVLRSNRRFHVLRR